MVKTRTLSALSRTAIAEPSKAPTKTYRTVEATYPAAPVIPRLFSYRESAALLKVSKQTLWRAVRSGQIKVTMIRGRRFFKESELMKLVG